MTMTPQDIQRLHRWTATLLAQDTQPAMILAMGRDRTKAVPFISFYEDFRDQVTGVSAERQEEHPSQLPTLLVGRHGNIAFHLIPSGKWFGFFLDAISAPDGQRQAMANMIEVHIEQLHLPVTLKLFVSHQCPHCPLVITQLLPLAQASPLVSLEIFDAGLFPEEAQMKQIHAVPTLIMEDQFRWTGPIDPNEILELAIQRDPAMLSPASLRQFLEDGRARQAAEMMMANNAVFPALIELLVDEKWPTRLAAMVVVENMAELAPHLMDTIIAPLWNRFDQCPTAVKGDLAYVLGVINTPNARDTLDRIVRRESDPQVKEAAMEALAEHNESQI
jgi:hypothetical protein